MLFNLVANAIKFTEEDGNIKVSWQQEGGVLIIQVQDDGIGIDRENLGRIFDRFYQVQPSSATSTKTKGSGLGLAISKNIIEQIGGNLWATSQFGIGSTFHIKLPTKTTTQT